MFNRATDSHKPRIVKILYVDPDVDEKSSSTMLESFTAHLSYVCAFTVVPNAFLGLESAELADYSLLIVRRTMEDVSGLEMLRVLEAVNAQVPVALLLSERESFSPAEGAAHPLFLDVLRNPYSIADLCRLIEMALLRPRTASQTKTVSLPPPPAVPPTVAVAANNSTNNSSNNSSNNNNNNSHNLAPVCVAVAVPAPAYIPATPAVPSHTLVAPQSSAGFAAHMIGAGQHYPPCIPAGTPGSFANNHTNHQYHQHNNQNHHNNNMNNNNNNYPQDDTHAHNAYGSLFHSSAFSTGLNNHTTNNHPGNHYHAHAVKTDPEKLLRWKECIKQYGDEIKANFDQLIQHQHQQQQHQQQQQQPQSQSSLQRHAAVAATPSGHDADLLAYQSLLKEVRKVSFDATFAAPSAQIAAPQSQRKRNISEML